MRNSMLSVDSCALTCHYADHIISTWLRRSVWCWCACFPCRAPSGLIRLDCSSSTSSWASSASSSNSERGWCLAIHAINLCIKPVCRP